MVVYTHVGIVAGPSGPPSLLTQVRLYLLTSKTHFYPCLVAEPEDEDVLEEAETIKRYLETLVKKNPLVVKEVSKVKLDSALLLYLFA